MSYQDRCKFEELKGVVISEIKGMEKGSDSITFITNKGNFLMFHDQDCCESVLIDDVCGDINDLIGSELLVVEENTSKKNPEGVYIEYQDSFTWTFYKLATVKGYVDIRWYGESNGYYSESVDFERIPEVN